MGFWAWLTGKKTFVTTNDKIWLTRSAKCGGMCRELQELRFSNAQPIIVLAHFPATLTEIQQKLSKLVISHTKTAKQISTKDVKQLAVQKSDSSPIQLGLVKQLEPDALPDQDLEAEGSVQILVAERHFCRDRERFCR